MFLDALKEKPIWENSIVPKCEQKCVEEISCARKFLLRLADEMMEV